MNRLVAAVLSATMLIYSAEIQAAVSTNDEVLVSTSRLEVTKSTRGSRSDTTITVQDPVSGEAMTLGVAASASRDRATVTIDGELQITYYFTPGNGQRGRELTHYEVDYRGEHVVAPAVQSANGKNIAEATRKAADLMRKAMLDLHDADFYARMGSELLLARASGGIVIQGWLDCTLAVIGLIASYPAFIACATVIGCVGAIILHQLAVLDFMCSCVVEGGC